MKRKLCTTTLVAVLMLLLINVGTTKASESGYTRVEYATVVEPTIDGVWTSTDEWTDCEPTMIGENVAFRSTFTAIGDDPIIVTSHFVIEILNDDTNDAGDYWQICIDGLLDGGSAPQTDDFRIDIVGHTSLVVYQGTGSGWTEITPDPSDVIFADSISESPTSSTPHWILEISMPKHQGVITMDIIWGVRVAVYDESNSAAGVQAWPPTDRDVPDGWGINNYTVDPYEPTEPEEPEPTEPEPTEPEEHDLTISVSGSGRTTPAVGTYSYDSGSSLQVGAIAESGWKFDHWLLDSANIGSYNPTSITINMNHNLVAVFTEDEIADPTNLVVHASPSTVTVNVDEEAIFTATASGGTPPYSFHWIEYGVGQVGDSNQFRIFRSNPGTYEFYCNVEDSEGWDTNTNHVKLIVNDPEQPKNDITISVTGTGQTLPEAGSYSIDTGSSLQVGAIAESGWKFDHWLLDSANIGSSNPTSVTMDKTHVLEAVFAEETTEPEPTEPEEPESTEPEPTEPEEPESTEPEPTEPEPTSPLNSILQSGEWVAVILSLCGLTAGAGGWLFRSYSARKRHKILFTRLMEDIDDVYTRFRMNTLRCETELYKYKNQVLEDFKQGLIDEEKYNILDARIDNYMKEIEEKKQEQ